MDRSQPRFALSPWHLLITAGLIAFATTATLAVWYTWRFIGSPSHSITEQFTDYLPTAGPADGILETATSSVRETFTRSDSEWLFNMIPLGTTVSEIRVPAVYRYHIQLFNPWKLVARGPVCVVIAPEFRPSLPPAIITDQMEKSTSAGWFRFNGEDNLSILERDITEELDRRADDPIHRDFVREACRQSVAEFVKTWMMKEDFWREDRFHQIVVEFPDDAPAGNGSLMNHQPRPTITFEDKSN